MQELIKTDIKTINRTLLAFKVNAKVLTPVKKPDGTVKSVPIQYQPKIFSYGFIIYPLVLAPGESIAKVKYVLGEMALALTTARGTNVKTVVRLITQSRLALEISIPKPKQLVITETCDIPTIPYAGTIGKSFRNGEMSIEEYNLESWPHTLIAAQSGHGKSSLMRVILSTMLYATSPDQLQVFAIDLKNDDLIPFKALPHVAGFAINLAETVTVIQAVFDELTNRIANDNKNQTSKILLVIDEVADLTMDKDLKDTVKQLCEIMRKGRSVSICTLIATQKPSKQYLDIVANFFTNRIIGKVDSDTSAFYATGIADSNAERLFQKGSFLICDESLTRVQVPFMSKEVTANFVAMIQRKYKKYGVRHRLFVPTTTTTTTDKSDSHTSESDSSAGSSSDSSSVQTYSQPAKQSATNVASISDSDRITEIVKVNYAEFVNGGLTLAGMIRLCFGANANTGGSNRNKVLAALEAVKQSHEVNN